jgi:hypothetical protein
MPESMYKPPADLSTSAPVSLNSANDQEGTSTTVSPTGAPVIPPAVVPWLVGLVGIATVVTQTVPSNTIGWKVASIIVGLGGMFGLASPGLRRQQ